MSRERQTAAAALVVAMQCLAIGWLVVRYERVATQGVELRFKCQAYDPYDPLRGRYLHVTVRETTTNMPHSVTNVEGRFGGKFVVRVEPCSNGLWRVAEAAFEPTEAGVWVKPKRSRVGRSLRWEDLPNELSWQEKTERMKSLDLAVEAEFPDWLFVNEKIASDAEKILRKKQDGAVAVYRARDGDIVLTDVEIDGQPILSRVREEQSKKLPPTFRTHRSVGE